MSITGSILRFFFGRHYDILSVLPETVLAVDENGKILYANGSALNLFETSSIKGKNINDFFTVNSGDIFKNQEENNKRILKIVTEKQNTKAADVRTVDVSSKGKKRFILTITDNTQDHWALNELIEEKQNQKNLNHTKNVLLSKMDSCLCSPLLSAAGFAQGMLSGLSGEVNDKQKKYLEIINSNTSELLLFIQNLIALSKAESDIYKFEYSSFDITMLVSAVLNEFQVKIKDRDIKLSIGDIVLQSNACRSDKTIVKNIISNLLENALSMIETGSITINLTHPVPELLMSKGIETAPNAVKKSYIMCEIICRGMDETLYGSEDIFDPYIQADKNSKKYLLQSLLLGSAKLFLKKLKGGIWVNNQYANQVSFVFALPADKLIAEGK